VGLVIPFPIWFTSSLPSRRLFDHKQERRFLDERFPPNFSFPPPRVFAYMQLCCCEGVLPTLTFSSLASSPHVLAGFIGQIYASFRRHGGLVSPIVFLLLKQSLV